MISVLIPAYNEGANISGLLRKLKSALKDLGQENEMVVVDAGSADDTRKIAAGLGARVIAQERPGYGAALKEGFCQARGDYIITMDADFSHHPEFIKEMWAKKDEAELVIASRYVPGGKSDASLERRILSIILNKFFSFALSLPFKDLSSGFRMYKREIIRDLNCAADDYSFLEESVIKIYGNGYKVTEVPFHYLARRKGRSHIKLFKFGISYCLTLAKVWRLRNSVFFADYEERAYRSRIPLQRFWHRQRFKIITGFIQDKSSLLDIGCGTSKVIDNIPDAIGLDIGLAKLRYLSYQGKVSRLVQADMKSLPFKEAVFNTVICSEVIEHVEKSGQNFQEINRVLGAKGELIIGTPDYSRRSWLIIEWLYKKILPHAYVEGHISRYSYGELKAKLLAAGFVVLDYKYILGSELIIRARKTI